MKKKTGWIALCAAALLFAVFCLLYFEGGFFQPCVHNPNADGGTAFISWEIDGHGTLTVSGHTDVPNDFIGQNVAGRYDKLYTLHARPKKIVRKIVINEGVTGIGDFAFSNLPRVTEIVLPDSVTKIGQDAFAHNGITRVRIPAGVTSISGSAFGNCKKLTDVQLADGSAAFVLEGGVLFTADKSELVAYFGSRTETAFAVPAGVLKLGERCFSDAAFLTQITVPEGVAEIGEAAFQFCDALKEVSLPGSLTGIGEDAFAECPALSAVVFGGSKARWDALAPALPGTVSVTFAEDD